ncbi:MAG: oxidoreductase [Verrucomicrobia bacterium]|nr:oxidoreductase [Verrucomicrobiota bacterium]
MNADIQKGSKVLITGATGFTGAVLARKLVERGASVRAIARPSSSLEALKDLQIDWIRGDVYDPATVAAATRDVEYIFHVAAAYREAGIADDIYRKVHVVSTQLLAEAALKCPSFNRFVHVSTVGVHGHIENPPADEEYPMQPGDIYQETKAEAEKWIRDFAGRNKLPFVVLRPAAIYGPGDKRLFKIFKMVTWPFFPILGRGRCLYHLVHVEDLTGIMMLAATHPAAAGQVFICGNPEPASLEGIAATIAETLGRRLRVLRIPAWPFFLAGDICEAVCKPLGIQPPIYRRRVAFFTKDRAFNTSKLRNLLGYSFKHTNESGLRQATEWYVANGWLKKV